MPFSKRSFSKIWMESAILWGYTCTEYHSIWKGLRLDDLRFGLEMLRSKIWFYDLCLRAVLCCDFILTPSLVLQRLDHRVAFSAEIVAYMF